MSMGEAGHRAIVVSLHPSQDIIGLVTRYGVRIRLRRFIREHLLLDYSYNIINTVEDVSTLFYDSTKSAL